MSESQSPMDVLNALMEERARYEQWLAQLDARRGTTPPHVFERVRGDYGERLKNVLDQLAGRATDLQVTAGSLADRVASLYADETALRDERAEAELRASVGEFTEEHALEVMERCDQKIATLGAERATVGAELGRVQEILAVAIRPPTPAGGEASIVPIESLAPAPGATIPNPTPASAAAPVASPPSPQVAAPKAAPAPSFDELAFLQSVVDRPSAPSVMAEPRVPTPVPEPRAESRAPAPAAPAPRPRMLEPMESEVPAAAQVAPSRRTAAPTPVLTSTPLVEKDGQEGNSALTPGSIPAFLKDMPTEQIKTLKCQECGTMNYPTEWYCERCGGELAAM
jgi:hypothetical protein